MLCHYLKFLIVSFSKIYFDTSCIVYLLFEGLIFSTFLKINLLWRDPGKDIIPEMGILSHIKIGSQKKDVGCNSACIDWI